MKTATKVITSEAVSLRAVIGGVVGAILLGTVTDLFVQHVLGGSEVWQNHRVLLLTTMGLFWVNVLLLRCRANYLKLSRWTVDTGDVAIAITVGYGVQSLASFFWPIPKPSADWVVIICLVVLVPALEELFVRGILLRSLVSVWPPGLSIAAVTILAAVMHPRIVPSLAPQLAFSVLYYQRRNSIVASMVCHCVTNAVVLFPSISLLAHSSIGMS